MDKDSWAIIIGLMIISSVLSYYYFEFPVNIVISFSLTIIIVIGALKIGKKVDDINKASRTE